MPPKKRGRPRKIVPLTLEGQRKIIIDKQNSTADSDTPSTSMRCSDANETLTLAGSTLPIPLPQTSSQECIQPVLSQDVIPSHLRKYFKAVVIDNKSKTGATTVNAECVECETQTCDIKKKTICMSNGNTFPLLRHLRVVHRIEASGKRKLVSPNTQTTLTDYTASASSSKSVPFVSNAFGTFLLDLICVDGLPFSVFSGIGFKTGIQTLLPNVKIRARTTIMELLKKRIKGTIVNVLQDALASIPPQSLALILDFWSNRLQQHVLGVTAQFIDIDWEVQHCLIAFKHCPDTLTSDVIELKMLEVLNANGLKKESLSCVMADNATNITKAFKPAAFNNGSNEDDGCSDEDINEEGEGWTDIQESSDEEELGNGPTISSVIHDQIGSWNRKRCICHTLNLLVKAALKKTLAVRVLLAQAKATIAFFKKSNKYHEKLKEKTGGLGLKSPIETRWNSLYFAIDRLCNDAVYPHLAIVILEYNSSAPGRKKPLQLLGTTEKEQLQKISELLRPIQIATDAFQRGSVTSCDVFWKLQKMIASIQDCLGEQFVELQNNLLAECRSRLPQLASDHAYTLAAVLDPRQKLNVFKTEQRERYSEFLPLLSDDSVRALLAQEIRKMEQVGPAPGSSRVSGEPGSDDIFSFLEISTLSTQNSSAPEHMIYLSEPVQKTDPLHFWKESDKRFPKLAILARRFLAVPASSADAERLFSVAGALQRARRSRITCENLENVLLYRDFRLAELKKSSTPRAEKL